MFNYSFIFLQIYEICSQSNPSIQCRLACPPDQSVPANSQSHLPFSSHQSLAGILSLLLWEVLSTSQRFFSFLQNYIMKSIFSVYFIVFPILKQINFDLIFQNRTIIVQIALQCRTIIFYQMSKYSQLNTVSEPVPIQKFNNRPEEGIQFFKKETNRLLLENYSLNAKLITSLEEKKQLADRIFELEKNNNESQEDKKKRHRRCANQIKRDFICKAEKCGKSYGSEGSLAQHVRLKHPELMPLQSESQERS